MGSETERCRQRNDVMRELKRQIRGMRDNDVKNDKMEG